MEGPFAPFTLTKVLEDVSKFVDGDWAASLTLIQHNVPWKLVCEKAKDNCNLLLCCQREVKDTDWSIDAKWRMSVLRTNGENHTVFGSGRFNRQTSSLGANNLMGWEDLLSKYVVKDEVIVDAEVWILEMTGIEKPNKLMNFSDEKAKENSDVVLLVENEKFYLTKQVLAMQSPYFHSLFFGSIGNNESEDSGMMGIKLEGVDAGHFQTFLEVIHHEPAINDDTLEQILQVSKKYRAKNITRQCEEFLIFRSCLTIKKKLQLVASFNLANLKRFLFGNFKSTMDVRAALDPDMEDSGILKALLLKSFELND
ncbi:hypothetical protein CAEBREN_15449 [Caenorhabditis brenneri]|uniref:BTB domain-containing protein n=1 Tax=Caenorhabditis brenneri TaxID=135651 RepID=G0NDB8_CAEBE|nr:hypothetical protein CAEBREN_15449 [Caenorhabditis brenneri]